MSLWLPSLSNLADILKWARNSKDARQREELRLLFEATDLVWGDFRKRETNHLRNMLCHLILEGVVRVELDKERLGVQPRRNRKARFTIPRRGRAREMPTITKGRSEEGGKTVLHVETTGDTKPCPNCHSSDIVGFGRRTQSVPDVPENGKPVVLRVVTRRFRCKACGRSFYESVDEVGGSRRMTDRLVKWIRNEAPSRRFTEIATETGLSEGTVRAVLRESGTYPRRKRE